MSKNYVCTLCTWVRIRMGLIFFSLTLRIYFMRQKDQATLHISYLLQRFEEELARLS